jgi:beta-ketoacyl synthase-like protein
MFYIHQATCISPQQTFSNINLEILNDVTDNKLKAVEPTYEGIPNGILRRMGKAVRMGIGTALPLISRKPDGIIIGTSNGGMEDCIKFLNQIIDYDEGMLAPGNFVQSTTNAIAGQLGMMSSNKGYNITHVHRAFAFENAMIDAAMLLKENPANNYLLGGVDEISAYNYNIEYLGGWYKKEIISNKDLYVSNSIASIAGEGSAMFLVNNDKTNAVAELQAIHIFHTEDENEVSNQLKKFLEINLPGEEKLDLLIIGENGDNRLLKYYSICEALINDDVTITRFKHMVGEYPTSSAIAVWLACYIMLQQNIPHHMIKKSGEKNEFKKVLIYNNYKGLQHSFILLSKK